MDKKYVKIKFNLKNSKKRTIAVKTIQNDAKDEDLKSLADFIENFIDGSKEDVIKVVETIIQ